jgi:thioesterase domain-containing protein
MSIEPQSPSPTQTFSGISPSAEPLVLCLQRGNPDHPPLFLIHPIGGDISCYVPLLRYLKADQGIYTLRAIGLEDSATPLNDIPLMAKIYIKAIQTIQPTGSYYLGGWSMGGIVAYEMALQLRQAQATVNAVVLIDSPAPIAAKREIVMDFMGFARGLGFTSEHIKPLSKMMQNRPQNMDEPLYQLLISGQKLGILPKGFSLESLKRLYMAFSAHGVALSHYTAQPCPGVLPTLFLKSTDQSHLLGDQAERVWQTLLGQSLITCHLSGDHYTLMVEPKVANLATYLNTFLGQTQLLNNLAAAASS